MEQVVCPKCGASINADLFAGRESTECPFCGADLSEFAPSPGLAVATDEPASPNAAALAHAWGVPKDSRIQIVQSDAEKLVLYIPPGAKGTASLGLFALVWNLFMMVFTAVWCFAVAAGNPGQGNKPPILILILFLGVFWAVGLGILYAWSRMKFTHSFLLLEKNRFAIQRTFFNRKWIDETKLGPDSRAALRESYRQRDNPVYKVAVAGTDKMVSFGTVLAHDEKSWLVDTLNRFWGVKQEIPFPGVAAEDREAHVVEAIRPDEIPDGVGLRVLESSPDKLVVQLPILSPFARIVLLVPLVVFDVVWLIPMIGRAFNQLAAPNGMGIGIALLAFMVIPTALETAVVLAIFFGKTRIELDGNSLRRIRRFGPIKSMKQVGTPSIRRVYVPLFVGARENKMVPVPAERRREITRGVSFCMVETTAAEPFALTLFQNLKAAHSLAGLLRYQLEQMGFLGATPASAAETGENTSH